MTNVAKFLCMPILEWLLQNHCDRMCVCVCVWGDKDSLSDSSLQCQNIIKLEREDFLHR